MIIAVIPDTHYPYCNEIKLNNGISILAQHKPDAWIQVGDLFDQLSFSNYPKDLSKCMNPAEQAQAGKEGAQRMWDRIHKLSPKSKKYQMPGNHDIRILKRFNEKMPQATFIGKEWFKHQMTFKGVQNVEDEFVLDDIMFMHGFRPMGQHAKWNQMKTVTGHTHKARIQYMQNRHGEYWEFNAGWIGDRDAYPFSYRWQKKIDDTHQGVGLIEHGNPRFISL